MKRSVAIYGPTPQFVRWAIGCTCPLRGLDDENLPDRTFRQLRGLREYSIGVIEDRIFEDVCIHPDWSLDNPQHARGFHASEVLDAHGDAAFVERCCRSCPANSVDESRPGVWAGCYGWLPATSGFSFDSALRGNVDLDERKPDPVLRPDHTDFVKMIDDVIDDLPAAQNGDLFLTTKPRWYGLWRDPELNREQVEFLDVVFELAIARCRDAGVEWAEMMDLIQFRDALKRCRAHRLALHVELVPPGTSDGQTWTLVAHCPDCKRKMSAPGPSKCPACGRIGGAHGQRKSKVLGLRPYVNLSSVMGETAIAEFINRYATRSSPRG